MMDSKDQLGKTENGQETESSIPSRKPYNSPKLTHYGKMSHLTRLGAGDAPNDGDNAYGSPVS